jgi:hypothetical protein
MQKLFMRITLRQSTVTNVACIVGLASLIAIVTYRIFCGITTIGINGVDAFLYVKDACDLLKGKVDLHATRISFYMLNYFAMKTLGANDYAVRAFIGVVALLNILLVYIISVRLSASLVVGLAAAVAYAFNPIVLSYAMTELPHIYGAFFVLSASAAWLLSIDLGANRLVQLFCCGLTGLCLALATSTHEDLVFFVLVFAPLSMMALPRKEAQELRSRTRYSLASLACFGFGFALGIAVPMFVIGIGPFGVAHKLFATGTYMQGETARQGDHFLQSTAPRFLTSVVELMGTRLSILSAVGFAVVPLAFAWFRAHRVLEAASLQLAVLGYASAFFVMQALLETNNDYARVLIPVLGLSMVATFGGYYSAIQLFLARLRVRFAAVPAGLIVAAFGAYVAAEYHPFTFSRPAVSVPRQLYDVLKLRVTPTQRLLLPTCFGFWTGGDWWGPASPVYFGENAISLLWHQPEPFEHFITTNSIEYILVPTTYTLQIMPVEEIQGIFAKFYGAALPPEIEKTIIAYPIGGLMRTMWSEQACAFESDLLRQATLKRGGRLLTSLPSIGDLYEVP